MTRLALLLSLAPLLSSAPCVPSSLSEKGRLAKFQELDRSAQTASDQGQFAAAAQHYRDAVCLAPSSGRALYGLGIAEAASGNFAAGRDALVKASAVLPESPLPLAMLVRVDVAMKNVERVKEDLRTAAQRFPKDGPLHSGLARFLAENQLLDLALAESLRFEQTGAGDPASVVALAVLENTVGAYSDAIRNGLAIAGQPNVPDAVKASAVGVTGLSYESMGDRDEAARHLKRAIELAPSQENSYLALADLYEKAHQFEEAIKILELGRRRLAQTQNFLLPLGNNLVWAEHYEEGTRILQELLSKAPNTPEAYVRLAEAYRNTGRPELEVQILDRLAAIKPDYPMVQILSAKAMLSQNPVNYATVLRVLARAEKTTPNDADIFYLRGRTYAATDRTREAVAAFQRAIELRPMDPAPYYQLGLAYRKLGQPELAQQAFARMQHVKQTATAHECVLAVYVHREFS